MRVLKKLAIGVTILGTFGFVATASYNSIVVNNDTFMLSDSGIKFSKRLDEINGKVVIGRMAASSTPWSKLDKKIKKVQVKQEKKKIIVKKEVKAMVVENIPSPSIKADLDLNLTKVFYKKSLKEGTFSGSAKTVDGIIEEIYVTLPNGKSIEINTQERMMGNVFKYEDPTTREMKSGMFYEVKKGTYMITLANDSQYPGARLEFKATNTEIAYNDDHYAPQENWDMNQQNENQELANDYVPTAAPAFDDEDYAQGNNSKDMTYGFNFQS